MNRDSLERALQRLTVKQGDRLALRWQAIDELAERIRRHLRPLFGAIDFSSTIPDNPWIAALTWVKSVFAQQQQRLSARPLAECPEETLPKCLRPYLLTFDAKGEPTGVHTDRYEFWLYRQLRKRLKSGELYLDDSLEHRCFTEELVSTEERAEELRAIDILWLRRSLGAHLDELATELHEQWMGFNRDLRLGKLKHLQYNGEAKTLTWHRPKATKDDIHEDAFYEQLMALQNKRLIYGLLFRASAATLLEVARDPRLLGAEIGFFSVLHTWDQRLQHHPHVHCVIAAGGLAPDHASWISSRRTFFLPVKVLGRVFRGKFVAGLKAAFRQGKLGFHVHLTPLAEPRRFAAWLSILFRHDWVVYSKRPFGGPEHALRYLGAYTHRVGISNRRLVALSDGKVIFRWRDSAQGNRKRTMSLPTDEFLRPLPPAPAPTWLRPHPQLRLPQQPPASQAAAALLQPARHRGRSDQSRRHRRATQAVCDPSQVPTLHRNHARRRAVLLNPTAPSVSTAAGESRRMNSQLQPRIQAMRRRASPVCAPGCSDLLKLSGKLTKTESQGPSSQARPLRNRLPRPTSQ